MRGPCPPFQSTANANVERSAARDATDHARADVGATLLTRAHSQTNPSTTSHISVQVCVNNPTASGTPEHPKARQHPRARGGAVRDRCQRCRVERSLGSAWQA
eukprot:4948778-Prymnesium_polylepis.1